MNSFPASGTVALRLAPTHATEGRVLRVIARTAAVAALALGLWQVIAVENGALGTLAGVGLVALAPSLARGRKRAHRWACVLLLVLVATAAYGSSAGPGYAVAAAALALLISATPAFGVLGDPATRRNMLTAALLAAGAGAADLAHAGGLLGHPLVVTVVCAAAWLAIRSLRPWRSSGLASSEERTLACSLIERYGVDTLAPFALRSDKRYFFDPSGEAFVAYSVVAGVAVASGNPIGRSDLIPGLIAEFDAHARRRGWVPAAVGVGADRLREWRALGFHAHYTGDEAVVNPAAFSLEGRSMRKVRQSVTRLEREGYRVEMLRSSEIDAELAQDLDEIADGWREGRTETGFSMAFQSARVDRTRADVYAVAHDTTGRARGFLHFAIVPAGQALSLSSMRRDRATPNGLNEFLICESLAWARAEGLARVSLNFAAFAKVLDPPVALDRVTSAERRVLQRLAGKFQLERLLAFNRKFEPDWTPRYIAYPSVAALPRIAFAVMLAEAYVVLPGWMRS
jgi:lysyl-tRNA synthetase, class II